MNKRIVLFGATGTIGAYTALHLNNIGYDVIAVGNRKSDNGFFADYGITYLSADITNQSFVRVLPDHSIYAVVHLAGLIPARMRGYDPQGYIDTIMTGTLNVMDYVVHCKSQKVICTQSISDVAYLCGNVQSINADSESHFPPNDDHSVYSICKTAAVNIIEHYYYRYKMQRYILRLPNIYLYHPNPKYFYNGIEKWQNYRLIIHNAILGLPVEIWGNPYRIRDIVYVKDCTQIIANALKTDCDGGMYNVGTGIGTSIEDQVRGIVEIFSPSDHRSQIIYRPDLPDTPQYVFDISKTVNELGYTPKYDYISYLKDMKHEMEVQTFRKLWGLDQGS